MPCSGERPAAVLVMPTLLRTVDELEGLKKAITSAATNGYPGDLTIVAAIDDGCSKPALFAELEAWAVGFPSPPRVRVLATCTKKRTGKAVAIDNGVAFLKGKIAEGMLPEFPPLFFNMDADSVLGEHALVRLVDRLTTRYSGSNQYPNIVTSNVSIARSEYWRGWREYFTVRGQLSIHVAAEFVVAMLGKHNLKLHLVPGASGALYCTWSQLHLQAPRWAAFMQTLTLRDALRWWLGGEPPSFAASNAGELPEAMTGPGDDTWVTWLAYCARWEGNELTLELPRTPAHALYYFLRGWFLRALQYEPSAVVETKTPTTIKALFKQRVRWNTSRVELSQRWSPALAYHWTLFFPTVISTILIVYFNSMEAFSLLLLPLSVSNGFFVHFCCALVVLFGAAVHGDSVRRRPRRWLQETRAQAARSGTLGAVPLRLQQGDDVLGLRAGRLALRRQHWLLSGEHAHREPPRTRRDRVSAPTCVGARDPRCRSQRRAPWVVLVRLARDEMDAERLRGLDQRQAPGLEAARGRSSRDGRARAGHARASRHLARARWRDGDERVATHRSVARGACACLGSLRQCRRVARTELRRWPGSTSPVCRAIRGRPRRRRRLCTARPDPHVRRHESRRGLPSSSIGADSSPAGCVTSARRHAADFEDLHEWTPPSSTSASFERSKRGATIHREACHAARAWTSVPSRSWCCAKLTDLTARQRSDARQEDDSPKMEIWGSRPNYPQRWGLRPASNS